MNVNKLKGKVVEKGLNIETLSEMIGIDKSSLYRKMNNSEKFTIGDVEKIRKALELNPAESFEIFIA